MVSRWKTSSSSFSLGQQTIRSNPHSVLHVVAQQGYPLFSVAAISVLDPYSSFLIPARLVVPFLDQVSGAILLGQRGQPTADPLPAIPDGPLGGIKEGGGALVGVALTAAGWDLRLGPSPARCVGSGCRSRPRRATHPPHRWASPWTGTRCRLPPACASRSPTARS